MIQDIPRQEIRFTEYINSIFLNQLHSYCSAEKFSLCETFRRFFLLEEWD